MIHIHFICWTNSFAVHVFYSLFFFFVFISKWFRVFMQRAKWKLINGRLNACTCACPAQKKKNKKKKKEEAHRVENRISHGENTSTNQVANSHDDAMHLLYIFVILNMLQCCILFFFRTNAFLRGWKQQYVYCMHNVGTKGSPITNHHES